MKNNIFAWFSFLALSLLLVSCKDGVLTDTNQDIKNLNWDYGQKIKMTVTVDDINKEYDLYMNLRITAKYKYSNIFVLIHQIGGNQKESVERREFKLALPDGEWLGSGSGNYYTFQLPFRKNYKFPQKGSYVFTFEQNMRDNPLRQVSDVGLRVEPVRN